MSRREALAGLAAVPLLATGCAGPTPGRSTPKKGVGTWEFKGLRSAMIQSGASWYFNWRTDPLANVRDAEFCPLVFGPADVTDAQLADAARHGRTLQGFNEPDHAEQGTASVATALDLWPRLQSTGLRLGSPATGEPADLSPWMIDFMAGVDERGLRVDFVCVHWYGQNFEVDPAVAELEAYLHRVHARYRRPIWLTEWALIDWTRGAPSYPDSVRQGEYAAASAAMMEGLDFVERYAWFAMPPWEKVPAITLFEPGPVITPAGAAYAQAG